MGFETNHGTINAGSGANFRKAIWAKTAMMSAEANLVFAKLVTRYDTEAKMGSTIVVPNIANLAAVDKTVATALSFQAISDTIVNISINLHKVVPFLLEDALTATSGYDLAQLYGEKAGYGIAAQIDTSIATLVASASQNVGAFNTDTLSDEDMLRAIQYLDDADAPQRDRAFVFKPEIKAHIFKVHDKFFDASVVGNGKSPITTGAFGDFYGCPAHISTQVYSTGDNVSNCLLQKEALALAVNMNKGLESGRIIEYLADAYVVQALYGVREMKSTFYVQIKS